jgi:hypothetical protein
LFRVNGMKMLYKSVLLSLFVALFWLGTESCTQSRSMRQIERRSHRNERLFQSDKSQKVKKAQEKAKDQKEEQQQQYKKAKDEDVKRREANQTALTKERMKETKKKADEFNNRGHECFFKRIFKRKKPKQL